ncbi:MAG: sigma factor-like helix-turn-helix DNA-binding protein [Tissierellia bacterium]|nr:sigma factor-like helix-turn-helix DNA-binding protein [Tissierellia bacterium]
MKKTLEINELMDFYSDLLTKRQQAVMKMYYQFDYSLNEIADNLGISKQAVSENIQRATRGLLEFEDLLGLLDKRKNQMREKEVMLESLTKISLLTEDKAILEEVNKLINRIKKEGGFYGI